MDRSQALKMVWWNFVRKLLTGLLPIVGWLAGYYVATKFLDLDFDTGFGVGLGVGAWSCGALYPSQVQPRALQAPPRPPAAPWLTSSTTSGHAGFPDGNSRGVRRCCVGTKLMRPDLQLARWGGDAAQAGRLLSRAPRPTQRFPGETV